MEHNGLMLRCRDGHFRCQGASDRSHGARYEARNQKENAMSKLCATMARGFLAFGLTTVLAGSGSAQETPVPLPPPPVVEPQVPVVVELTAVEGAEGRGEATLRATAGDQTEAVLEVEGLPPGTEWSGFLIAGSCDQPGTVITPLGTIEVTDQGTGRGEASVTTALGELTAAAATVQVHPHGETPTQAVLCGAVLGGGPQLPGF
jgi:hypothetical protein